MVKLLRVSTSYFFARNIAGDVAEDGSRSTPATLRAMLNFIVHLKNDQRYVNGLHNID
jgi:hypothetical protein